MVPEDKPYNPYPYDGTDDLRFYTKSGLLGAWKARASQYAKEMDPWSTYNSVDKNKLSWTWRNVWDDPMGTFIGRDVLTEEEIETRLMWKDKEEVSVFVKKESDYMRILPTDGEEVGGSAMYHSNMLEKKIVHARILNTFQEPFEVEDENHYERRVQFDLNHLLHRATFGLYKYDPYECKSVAPGRTGYPGGNMVKEKPVSGPNIRGRYARDLRGDKDVLYEFTNTSEMSHLGSDLGSMGHANAEGKLQIKNKFLYQETLD
ncbi:uncharacterized protein LOC134814140 [Bolinopsis microptera]|uniref:uncharacterized protein LOC134814140 n=1 Tax=Bolinopsis microptera TaxID=2820187 RepID=UPI003078C7D4